MDLGTITVMAVWWWGEHVKSICIQASELVAITARSLIAVL
jgi:hypothetical protein